MIADLFNLIALLVILGAAICRINLMTGDTRRTIKLSYIALATGAFAEGVGVMVGRPSGWLHALLVAGIAGVLLTERRGVKCYQAEDCR